MPLLTTHMLRHIYFWMRLVEHSGVDRDQVSLTARDRDKTYGTILRSWKIEETYVSHRHHSEVKEQREKK